MASETQVDVSPSRWLDEHGDALYRYAVAMVKDPTVAEELVQDAFVAGLESLPRYRGKSNPRGWLFGILRHKIHDHFRRTLRQKMLDGSAEAEPDLFDAGGAWLNPPRALPRDPHQLLSDQEFRRTLKLCLDRLPEIQRSVLLMRAFEEMPADEICKELNLSTTYLWVLVHRARNSTRQCLEEGWSRRAGD